jgi:hypothetical protein
VSSTSSADDSGAEDDDSGIADDSGIVDDSGVSSFIDEEPSQATRDVIATKAIDATTET